jgi:hypothetical protein
MHQHPILTKVKSSVASAYALLLGACFFLWPAVTGIPQLQQRYLWIVLGFIAIAGSSLVLAVDYKPKERQMPAGRTWIMAILCAAALGAYAAWVPYLEFSDEILIALPGMTIVGLVIGKIGVPLLLLGTTIAAVAAYFVVRQGSWLLTTIIVLFMACFAAAVASTNVQSGLALRYPPLIHVMQMIASTLSGGSSLYRLQNVLWTIFLIIGVWTLLPDWKPWRKMVLIAGVVLGPLAWTYRIVMFQAGAEITVGLIAVLLLRSLVMRENKDAKGKQSDAALLGATFALWFLTRPSSLSPILVMIGILLLSPKLRKAGIATALTAAPVVLAWLYLSPYYTFQYNFEAQTSKGFASVILKMIDGITASIDALPHSLGLVALSILFIGTLFTLIRGSKSDQILIACAWIIAAVNGLAQNAVINDIFYGVARYNILLVLPLGIGLAGFFEGRKWQPTLSFVGLGLIALLVVVTPFNFTEYTQYLRATSDDIWRTPPEGYLASPLLEATRDVAKTDKSFVLIAPGSQFMDLLIVEGLLTPSERASIMQKSLAWTPKSTQRPVIVQAPLITSYQPNQTPEQEQRLRDAATWARTQPNHSIVRVGEEEVIVVR